MSNVETDVSVSQDEMNALMETIREGSENRSREAGEGGGLRDVVRYDLVAARTVGGGQLPTLDLVNERLAGLLSETLMRLTGRSCSVVARAAQPVKCVECLGNLTSPACLQVLELGGLRGTGIMCFDPSLLFHILDLLLGGTPTEVADAAAILQRRGLTMVEKRLFAHVVRTLAGEVTQAWEGVAPLTIRPVRAETEPKHVALFEQAEMVVDAVFEVDVAGAKGELHLVLPQSALRPIEKKLASGLIDNGNDEMQGWADPLTGLLREVTVLTTAELGRTVVTLRDLLSLEVGKILRLDREPENPITVYVEGSPKLMGNPTLSHGNIAIEITSKLEEIGEKTPAKGHGEPS